MSNWSLTEESEYKQLLAAIANIEHNMALPASREVSTGLLTYLNLLKTRAGALEERQKAFEQEKERTESLQRVAVMVERETALNAAEKAQYGSFLKQEYFTKADFTKLDEFYASAYDRLTEGGKAEMSHRVWEGVRREEYRFTELPERVKEKEAESLRDAFRAGEKMPRDLKTIPDVDRNDFINAWDGGRKTESYKVLDRPSFTKSVATSAAVVPASVLTAEAVNGTAVKDAMKAKAERAEKPAATPELMGSVEFKAGDLGGASLCTPDMQPPLTGTKKPGAAPVKGH